MNLKHLVMAAASAGMLTLACAPAANAAVDVWNFTWQGTGPLTNANLTFFTDATQNGDGSFNLLGVAGNIDGDSIVGLDSVPAGTPPLEGTTTDGGFYADDRIMPIDFGAGTGPFSYYGPALIDSSGTTAYNLWMPSSSGYTPGTIAGGVTISTFNEMNGGRSDSNSSFFTLRLEGTTGGVPEPASWALMIIGFGGIGATMRARKRQLAAGASA